MRRLLLLMSVGLAACATTDTTGSSSPSIAQAPHNVASSIPLNGSQTALKAVMDDHWEMVLRESPTFATTYGKRDYDAQLDDPSLAAYERGVEQRRALLSRLEKIKPTKLTEQERLNRDLLMLELSTDIDAAEHPGKYVILTNRGGPHLTLTSLPKRLPLRTEADYRSYVARLRQMPTYLATATARIKAGVDQGWTHSCEAMAGYEDSINAHVVIDPADSVFMTPFKSRPSTIASQAFDAMKAEAAHAIRTGIVPAFRQFETFYNFEYQPLCREDAGVWSVPWGDDYYRHRVKLFTTTDMTPEDVHQVGLSEVARIRAEMEEIAAGEGFSSLKAFQAYLRSDPQFYPKTAEDRMERASAIAKRMDGQAVKLFTKMPRMPYDIQEIPLDVAEKTTTAYYSPPAGDGSRAGTYWLNTTKLDTRPLYELEALTLHEAVPGHHFQIALAQELDLPPFRSYGGFTAFIEGWGLYSERLGLEVGFYDTPYTNFGRLSYEMWRATRLVVDTGMHAKKWTRQQAIDYMADNTGLSLNNITTEVDRYITWPGQALAYKIGELKIRELRARAEDKLGADFDVRLFHDELLRHGAVPLSVLEANVDAWIASQM